MSVRLDPESVRAIAEEVASLLERRTEPGQLLTAGQVAARFNVERAWVYAHARGLGVVRLTESSRSRLRFDPAVVAQRLLAESPAARLPERSPPRRRFVRRPGEVPLLPVRGRTLVDDSGPVEA